MKPSHESSTAVRRDLTSIVLEVLGDLAFMLTDDQPADWSVGTISLQGEITYRGCVSGTLRCWCTRGFAARLAANLLGIEAEQREAQADATDAVREFLNVLCGQLITVWHGRQGIFDLAIPRVHECSGAPVPGDREPRYLCRLSVEGEPLFCTYHPNP
jgi:CheY-specific phosphatase CheX